MKNVGETLKNRRLEKKLSLKEVAKATRIKKETLASIEANQFSGIASEVATKGFIKNYAEFLELNSSDLLAIFRRDFFQPKKSKVIHPIIFHPLNKFGIDWSPKLTLIIVIVIFLLALFGYLGWQYFRLIRSPYLKIISPKNGQQFVDQKMTLVGKSDPDSVVKINGNLVLISNKGDFNYELALFPGENKIMVESVSKFGKKTIQERTVFRLDKSP